MIGPNSIIPYDGTNASIPSGWTRDTRFDEKFIKSATSGWGDTGGASTHTHSIPSHSHTISAHTHSSVTGQRINGGNANAGTSGDMSYVFHIHPSGSTGNSGGEASAGATATTGVTSNLPPYYDVIFIKSMSFSLIPASGMIFHTGVRSGMAYHAASENRFLRGATSGGDAGGTGGAAAHLHSQSHTHSVNAHSHATGNTGPSDGNGGERGSNSTDGLRTDHTHAFTVSNSTQNMNANSDNTSSSNLEPLHKTLKHYKATVALMPLPGDIALTTELTNPIGWITCDGTNGTPDMGSYYVKNTQSAGSTGGANTHDHTLNHSHTGSGTHTHSASPTNTEWAVGDSGRNGSGKETNSTHQHNITSIGSTTANYDTTNCSLDTVSNEPPYLKVRFIQMKFSTVGGSFLLSMM